MVTSDPIIRYVYQPIVDLLGLRPSRASAVIADGFLMSAIALTLYRFASPGDLLIGWCAMHMVGAIILHWWMRWCAANGQASMAGPLGILHTVMRAGLLGLAVLDAVKVHQVSVQPDLYMDGALMRTVLQLAEDLLGASALYLSACGVPPQRRRRRTVHA